MLDTYQVVHVLAVGGEIKTVQSTRTACAVQMDFKIVPGKDRAGSKDVEESTLS